MHEVVKPFDVVSIVVRHTRQQGPPSFHTAIGRACSKRVQHIRLLEVIHNAEHVV